MQITAKLLQILPLQAGEGKNGPWRKQDIIVETEGQYPKKICVSVWGDKIDILPQETGSLLRLDFDIESREFNGKWYTDVKAWRIESVGNDVINKDSSSSYDIMGSIEDNGDVPF